MGGFFGLFNYEKPGRGVGKDEPQKRGFFLFFELYFRKFWRICSLSLSYTLFCVPGFLLYFFYTTFLMSNFSPIKDPGFISYMSIYATLFLLSFVGLGPASAGHAYVLRNFSREEHSWPWDDFWSKSWANMKQGLGVLILDLLVIGVLFSAASLYLQLGDAMPFPPLVSTVLGFLAILFLLLYIMMHFFIFPMMVTLDMKLGEILKTSFLLTISHLPGTVCVFLLSGLVFGLFIGLYYLNVGFLMVFAAVGFSSVAFVQYFYGTRVIDEILEAQSKTV